MTEEQRQESAEGEAQQAQEQVDDLEVPSEEAEDVKGGLSDFQFTKKIDKSSPTLFNN
jgi:type VI protein secretion system component Hcp